MLVKIGNVWEKSENVDLIKVFYDVAKKTYCVFIMGTHHTTLDFDTEDEAQAFASDLASQINRTIEPRSLTETSNIKSCTGVEFIPSPDDL
jgi:hypothetical protein